MYSCTYDVHDRGVVMYSSPPKVLADVAGERGAHAGREPFQVSEGLGVWGGGLDKSLRRFPLWIVPGFVVVC